MVRSAGAKRAARRKWRAGHIAPLMVCPVLLLLAAKCPGGVGSAAPARPRTAGGDSSQQIVYGPSMIVSERSVAHGKLVAQTARVYDGGARVELQGVTFTFMDSAGLNSGVLTAREGTYRLQGATLDARGKVSIVRTDGRRLESDHVVLDYGHSTISADGAFTYADSPSSARVSGTGFQSDTRLRRSTPARKPRPTR